MNKTRRCAGRVHACICLKSRNKFTIQKKSFFQPIINFFRIVLLSRFDPKHDYKMVNKSLQKTVNTEACSERIASRHISDRSKTANNPPTHITINTPHSQIPDISTTRPRSFIAYRTLPNHFAKPAKNNLHPFTSWPLSGGRRVSVSSLIYRLLFIQNERN